MTNLIEKCSAIRLGRHNLFDVIRLYAALQVMISHGSSHLGFELLPVVNRIFSLPGVPIFFSISGFLVGLSFLRLEGRYKEYAWHRVLRIYPALWICLLVSCCILLAFGKGLFLLSPTGFSWLAAQATFVQFFNPAQLRNFGVGVINGSLWTIPVELQFYVVLPLLLATGSYLSNKGKSWLAISTLILISALSIWINFIVLPGLDPDLLATKLLKVTLLPYFYQFLLGFSCIPLIFIIGKRNSIFLLIFIGVCFFVAASLFSSVYSLSISIGLATLPIGIGLVPVDVLRGLDISYGLYIYHGLILNTLLALGGGSRFAGDSLMIIYFLSTIFIALLSWLLIEKPALKFKSKISTLFAA